MGAIKLVIYETKQLNKISKNLKQRLMIDDGDAGVSMDLADRSY